MSYIEDKYRGYKGYSPYMNPKARWSMEEVFGDVPPYSPEVFKQLCPRTKWFGDCIEGNSFCTSCGTLEPSVPNSHHPECDSYADLLEYPEDKPFLGGCPNCKEDSLTLDSSKELSVSYIQCSECDYYYRDTCCEEALVDKFIGIHNE